MKLLKAGDPYIPIIALDVGDKRIGVAVSQSGVIASTLPTISETELRPRLDAIEVVVRKEKAVCCLVGLPLLEGGAPGEQAEKTLRFARSLARRIPELRFVLYDERHSTADARALSGGKSELGRLDQLAAAILLQEFLDARSEKKIPPPGTIK